MNEEAIKDAYNLFVQTGYNQDINTFKQLIGSNPEALQDAYNLFVQTGYNQDINTFKSLMGVGVVPQEDLKKKGESGTMELPLEESLSVSQYSGENVPEFFSSSIGSINSKLINETEEIVVPKLQYQFGPMGFKFEEAGWSGDYMNVTAPNGQKIEISLDPYLEGTAKSEAQKLQKFILDNTKISGLSSIENQYKEDNQKFLNDEDVSTQVKSANDSADAFRNEMDSYLNQQNLLDQERQYLESLPTNQPKDETTLKRISDYQTNLSALENKKAELEKKQSQLSTIADNLKISLGKYTAMKAEQGTVGGAVWDSLLKGLTMFGGSVINTMTDIGAELMSYDPTSWNGPKSDVINAAKNLGINIPSIEIKKDINGNDYVDPSQASDFNNWYSTLSQEEKDQIQNKVQDKIKKKVKYGDENEIGAMTAVLDSYKDVFGSSTTKEFVRAAQDRSILNEALIGVAGSIPAMALGGLSKSYIAMGTALYARATDALYEEMSENPNFNDVPESEKRMISAPIGIAEAALESIGLRNVIANKGLMNRAILAAIGKSGATTTAKTFGELVQNEIKSKIGKFGLTLAGAALAEAETGAAQQVSEYAFKDIYNAVKEKDLFNTPDFLSKEYFSDIGRAAAAEAIGGLILGVPSSVSAAYKGKGFQSMDDRLFKIFEASAKDSNIEKSFIAELKTKVAKGELKSKEAKEILNNYRNSVGLFNSMPENLTSSQKKDAMNLLKEKKDLTFQIQGKDDALTRKQRNRINDINDELVALSEKAADNINVTLPSGARIIVDPEDREEFDRLNESYNKINRLKEKAKENLLKEANTENEKAEVDAKLNESWQNTPLFQIQQNILSRMQQLDVNAPTKIFSTIESLTAALQSLPLNERQRSIQIDEDGNRVTIDGNENLIADLYYQASSTPENKRNFTQDMLMENVQVSLKTPLTKESSTSWIDSIANDREITMEADSLEEIPEMFRQQAKETMVSEPLGRRKILGMPIGKPQVQVVKKYTYNVTGADIKANRSMFESLRAPRAATMAGIEANAIKSLQSIFPNVKVVYSKNSDDMKAAIIDNHGDAIAANITGNEGGQIVFGINGEPEAIYLNEQNKDSTTLAHEIWHAILYKAFGANELLFQEFRNELTKILTDNGYGSIVNKLNAFADTEDYKQSNSQAEEWLVQFGGYLAASGLSRENISQGKNRSFLLKLKSLFNKYANRIVGYPIFLEDATPDTILDFMISFSDRMSRGESLSDLFRDGSTFVSGGPRTSSQKKNLKDLEVNIENNYGANVDLFQASNGDIILSSIVIPAENRGKGIGNNIMADIINYADNNGSRILLTPSKSLGATSIERLKIFYKSLGFIDNKGANKDFTIKESMYRKPLAKAAQETEDIERREQVIKKSTGETGLEENPVYFNNVKEFANKSSFDNKIQFKNAIQDLLTSYIPELKKKYGKTFNPSKNDELTKQYLSDIITSEAVMAIKEHPEAIGWYDEKTRAALDVISAIHPEIATDNEARGAFILPLAVMSNGNLVDFNFDLAEKQYAYFKKNRRFNPNGGFGIQQSGIKKSILLINSLLDNGLSMSDINSFLTSKYKAGDLKVRIDGKLKDLASGELANEMVYGAVILGPKIGNGFYMNLWGQFDQLTMDRWFMRTWGRLTGTLVKIDKTAISEGKNRVSNALAAIKSDPEALVILKSVVPKLSGLSIVDLAKTIQKTSMDKESRAIITSNPKTDELRKASNSLSKNISGEKEAPSNGNERKFIRDVFTDVARRLKEEHNIDITMADLQAVLWYPEKILYESFKGGQTFEDASEGYTSESAPDYLNAAKKLATKLGINETEINQALSRGRERAQRNIGKADTTSRESVSEPNKEVLGRITETIAKPKQGQPRVKKQNVGGWLDANNVVPSKIKKTAYDMLAPLAKTEYAKQYLDDLNTYLSSSIDGEKFYRIISRIVGSEEDADTFFSDLKKQILIDGPFLFRTEEDASIGFQYDTDKVARERFNIFKLKKIGAGSDRVVFDIGNDKVLKIAKTARGLEQNIYEGDGYLSIIPNIYERGLNYVVVDKIDRIKSSDLVPIYNEDGDQIGEVKAATMFSDLGQFSQRDFDSHRSELQYVLTKYGLIDIMSYNVLWGDFIRSANWGYKNGVPYHIDGGTFGGIDMLNYMRGKKDLTDPDFRNVYDKSKKAKKEFADTDAFTKFQRITESDLKEIQNISRRYNINIYGFAPSQVNDKELARAVAKFGLTVKRAKMDAYGRGNGVYLVDSNGRFFNPFAPKYKKARINLGASRLVDTGNITDIPGYQRMLDEVNGIIDRGRRRGHSQDRIMNGVMAYVMGSAVYTRANDSQREQLVRNVQTEFGKRLKSAPSAGRLLGTINNVKKITLTDKELLKTQIKLLARGARTAIAAWRRVSRELSSEVKQLVISGKITNLQAANVIRRLSAVNMFNEDSIDKFIEYMTKVFEDSNYAEKINKARRLLPNAKRNLKTKMGIANSVIPNLQQLFAINPNLIPDSVLDKYLSILEMIGQRAAVLELQEVSGLASTTNEILDAIAEEVSLVEELAIRFDNYADKVFDDDGNLDYAATLKSMVDSNVITKEDSELMSKYKSQIIPRVIAVEMTEDEINSEKDAIIRLVQSSDINVDNLPTRDERTLGRELIALLDDDILNQMSLPQLRNLVKLIDNINNGYLPHYAELTVERLESFKNSDSLLESVELAKPAFFSKAYSRFKNLFTKKGADVEMIRRNPLFYIDQIFGDYKTKKIFDSIFKGISEAQALFDSEIGKINKLLDEAHESVAKSFKYNSNKTLMSSYKMMTYMLQLEYNNNPESNQVHQASKVIKATIKLIDSGKTKYGNREAEMLSSILNDYSDENGEIDVDALYDSFNSAEKMAISTIQNINESVRDKAVYTAAVIRGDRINPLNNYVHHYVINANTPDENLMGTQLSENYNNSLRPSTRGQSLIERERAVSPLNFDVFASAQRGAKFVLLDYTMTKPIRTARKTLAVTRTKIEEANDGRMPKNQRDVFNAIESAFDEVVRNVLTNNFITDSFADEVVNFISKSGYRAILASVPRFISELSSNIGFVMIANPKDFVSGTKYKSIVLSPSAVLILDNVGSKQTNRLFNGDTLSGRFIDRSVLSQSSGVKSATAKGDVTNTANMIYNLTLKKYKNAVELLADTLISTPDKLIMRPLWFGSFANEFKKQTGAEVDFDKIASNDEAYMNNNKEAIEAAKNKADEQTILAGATDNAFMGMLKGTVKPNQSFLTRFFNNFNNFMTRFAIYEYTTARQGIYAAMGNGTITRKQGVALLSGVATRMTLYTLLTQILGSTMLGIFGEDDEDDEKTFTQKFGQALSSTATGLILGRDFGNATKSLINYGVELGNEKFLTALREGEYDPYKDAISFSIIPKEKQGKKTTLSDFITQMGGSFGPALKTADLIARKSFEPAKKEEEAIERTNKEIGVRIPLEVLGHLGLVPLYKDIRKVVIDQMYRDLEHADKRAADKKQAEKEMLHGYENKTDMKRYNPELYDDVFGKDSPGYNEKKAKQNIKKAKEKLERQKKDALYEYVPKKKETKKKNASDFGSDKFGSDKFGNKD